MAIRVIVLVLTASISLYAPRHTQSSDSGLEGFARVVFQPHTKQLKPKWLIQTSVRILSNPDTGVEITLVSMHHLGSTEYFRGVQSLMARGDLILAEGWKEGDLSDVHGDLVWLKRFQRVSARVLSLSYQKDWEASLKIPNLQYLDMDKPTLKSLIDKFREPLVTSEFKEYVEYLEGTSLAQLSESDSHSLRQRLERIWLSDVREYAERESSGKLASINEARDKLIFDGIRNLLSKAGSKRICLMYGAAHLWKVEPKLIKELGFKRVSVSWLDAMASIESDSVEDKPEKK